MGRRVGPWSYFLTGGGRGVVRRASCCERPHGVHRGVAPLESPGLVKHPGVVIGGPSFDVVVHSGC